MKLYDGLLPSEQLQNFCAGHGLRGFCHGSGTSLPNLVLPNQDSSKPDTAPPTALLVGDTKDTGYRLK